MRNVLNAVVVANVIANLRDRSVVVVAAIMAYLRRFHKSGLGKRTLHTGWRPTPSLMSCGGMSKRCLGYEQRLILAPVPVSRVPSSRR